MNKTMKMTASKLTKITLAGALLASPLLMAEKAEASHKQDAVGNSIKP